MLFRYLKVLPPRPEHCLQVNLCYLRVGGLIGTVSRSKNGLYPSNLSGITAIDSSIKITMTNIYSSPAFKVFLYDGAVNSLAEIVLNTSTNTGSIRTLGSFNADVYLKDTIIYIRPKRNSNTRLDVTPYTWNFDTTSKIESVQHSEVDAVKSSFVHIVQ